MLALDTDRKIAGLYIFSTTIALLLPDALSVWLESIVIKEVWKAMMQGYSGWFDFVMSASRYVCFYTDGIFVCCSFEFQENKENTDG